MQIKHLAFVGIFGSWLCLVPAWAQEFTPVRRTTIVTADLEASLAFYRDLLGFTIEWDVQSAMVGSVAFFPPGTQERHGIALRQGPRLGGSIGLVWAPDVVPVELPCPMPAPAGSVALLILTDDMPALKKRLDEAGVVTVGQEVAYEHSRGPTEAFAVYDPNCIRVAFAFIKEETLQESMSK